MISLSVGVLFSMKICVQIDRYSMAYNPITLPCISFMFIKMKFIHSHSCLTVVIKSMSIYND